MKKRGFTLIELIVVMAIISILVLLGVPKYKSYTEDARVTKLTVEAKELEKASQQYYMRNNVWPRLSDEAYTADEVKEFSNKVYSSTGKVVELEVGGNYYDIDYSKLSNYISKPSNKENYILQNPVGNVYSLYGLTNKRLPQEIIEDIEQGEVKQIAVGDSHTLALMADGSIKSWGRNSHGQLGYSINIGTNNPNPNPTTIPELTGVKEIFAGDYQSFALLEDGSVKSWGRNSHGQLGYITNIGTNNSTPTTIEGLTGVKKIVSGAQHTLALLVDGSVKSWGWNFFGELGYSINVGTTNANVTPTTIVGLTGVKQISANGNHSLALLNDGSVKSWGYNYYGQLGYSTNAGTEKSNSTPTTIAGLSNVKEIVAGVYHSLALLEDGSVKSWGYNLYGELGYSTNVGTWSPNPNPTTIVGLTDVKDIFAGEHYSFAILEDNSVKGCGKNGYGVLGYSATNKQNPTPTTINGLTNVKDIFTGNYYSLALLEDGSIQSWGSNVYGELGSSTNIGTYNPTPTTILGLE